MQGIPHCRCISSRAPGRRVQRRQRRRWRPQLRVFFLLPQVPLSPGWLGAVWGMGEGVPVNLLTWFLLLPTGSHEASEKSRWIPRGFEMRPPFFSSPQLGSGWRGNSPWFSFVFRRFHGKKIVLPFVKPRRLSDAEGFQERQVLVPLVPSDQFVFLSLSLQNKPAVVRASFTLLSV